ncbi:MAG TPA: DUF4214 domain-containing protein [Thermoanaerobaculia bacterium]|nr:DUF4214 domain-containing protein [Thermoanaerobaculia bacterium]
MIAVLLVAAAVTAKVPPPVRVAVCDPNHFLSKVYQDLLGRPIDPAATNYWLTFMKNGASRAQVATEMMRSNEYKSIVARDAYNMYLHRAPSASDIAAFAGELPILSSNEYFTRRGGGMTQGFINALYQDVLGRAADPQAIALFSNVSRSAAAQQVLSSTEARQRAINALYSKYLHHAAPPSAFSLTHDQAVTTIIASDEYCRQ